MVVVIIDVGVVVNAPMPCLNLNRLHKSLTVICETSIQINLHAPMCLAANNDCFLLGLHFFISQ